MSSLGLDPNVPLPPVDDDSELVGKNDKLGKPDPGDEPADDNDSASGERVMAMPVAGGAAFPIPATADKHADE